MTCDKEKNYEQKLEKIKKMTTDKEKCRELAKKLELYISQNQSK